MPISSIYNTPKTGTIFGTGEIVSSFPSPLVSRSQTGEYPFIISGVSLHASGKNGTVSTAFSIGNAENWSVTSYFDVEAGSSTVDTGLKQLSRVFYSSPSSVGIKIYANGAITLGTGNASGISISTQNGFIVQDKALIGSISYIQVPSSPTNIIVDNVTSSSSSISFSVPSDDGGSTIAGYRVQISSDKTFSGGILEYDILESSISLQDLAANTTYYVRVLAKNDLWAQASNSGSAWSTTKAFTTLVNEVAPSSGNQSLFRYTEPSKSNLYSEKIFAEHPLSLWSLDDKADYISLVDEEERDPLRWSADGGTVVRNSPSEVINNFVNPSFETIGDDYEVKKNHITNPSFEVDSGTQEEMWRNISPNPRFATIDTSATYYQRIRYNYVLNPSFETNVSNWTQINSSPAPTRVTTSAVSGTYSGQVAWTAVNQGLEASGDIGVTNSTKIIVSAYVRSTSGSKNVSIGIRYYDGGVFQTEDFSPAQTVNSTGWTRVSYAITSPWEGFSSTYYYWTGRLAIKNATAGSSTVMIDGVQLEGGSILRPYFDGSTAPNEDISYMWGTSGFGTAHASNSVMYSASTKNLANTVTNINPIGTASFQSAQWISSTGNYSLKIKPMSDSVDTYTKITGINLLPNTTYTALAKIKLSATQGSVSTASEYARKFRATIGNKEIEFNYISEAPNTVGEHIVRATFNTSDDATVQDFMLYNGDNVVDVWWKDFAVVEGVYLSGFFDSTLSPDSDMIPSSMSGTAGILKASTPKLPFTTENGKAIMSSLWSSSGTKSLKLISTSYSQPSRYFIKLEDLGLMPNVPYVAMVKRRIQAPQTGTLFDDPDINPNLYFKFSNVAGTEEGKIEFVIDGTNIKMTDEISLYNMGKPGAGDVWWDDFCITEGDSTVNYFDGSSISSNPDYAYKWTGNTNDSTSILFGKKPAAIDNGIRSSEWPPGGHSLKVLSGTENIDILVPSTIIVTAQNAGQEITTNLGVYTTTSEETVKLSGVTSLQLGVGNWDKLMVTDGQYLNTYFDGNTGDSHYYLSWEGTPNNSRSIGTPVESYSQIFTPSTSAPFPDSFTALAQALPGASTLTYISETFSSWLEINDDMSSLSIGAYIYIGGGNVGSIELGYQYSDSSTDFSSAIYNLQTTTSAIPDQWTYISSAFASMPKNKYYRFVIKVNVIDIEVPTNVLINGITVGQWGEEFQLTSLGADVVEIPASIGISDYYGIIAEPYGLQDSPGYYVINNNRILARNTGMPMVYGSNNITSISPHPDEQPSLVIPGNGFLNNSGRYKNYTVEFWCRINSGSSTPRKIFGPLWSSDGLYVDGPFMTLKIGNYVGSHYVSEWYRPMLISISYSSNIANLIIDGSVVVTLTLDTSTISFPDDTKNDIDQDWLGFYAYEDVPQIEVDSFGIYTYMVPPIVAKRRFVYGQGVEFPEVMNSAFNGKTALVDHTFSDYTNSYRYPDIGKWIQGINENTLITNNVLSTPKYDLPSVVFDKRTTESWYSDLAAIGDRLVDTVTLKPNSTWDNVNGYMLFNSLDIVKQGIKAFYAIFFTNDKDLDNEVLFKIEDDSTKNYFMATISGTMFSGYRIDYIIKYGVDLEPELAFSENVATIDESVYIGINIDLFSKKHGKNLPLFFGNAKRLSVYIGGSREFEKTFSGDIERVGFCTSRNFSKISDLFTTDGTMTKYYDAGDEYFGNNPGAWDEIVDGGMPTTAIFTSRLKAHIASYTLFAKQYYDEYKMDVATDSYWEDYIPLSYLGKETIDDDGDMVYSLDFMQFNIDYPRPISYIDDAYDTSNSLIRTYISFQYISTGANQISTAFTSVLPAPKNNVIDASESWINTKFEVVNNMIIYPPTGVDFKKLALVMHVEIQTNGTLDKKVKIKNLQVTSKALNANQPNKIGTKLGVPLYPYSKRGIYYDYQDKNPYTVYRGSTPYLYLTKDSGVKMVGNIENQAQRGLSMTVNIDKSSRFRLTALQGAMMFSMQEFPSEPMPILEIDANSGTIQIYVISSHLYGKRGTIYAIDKSTRRQFTDAIFFLNGRYVKSPTVSLDEWNMISVAFINNIALDGSAGAVKIVGPAIFNNLSFYEETALQQARQATIRDWQLVKYDADSINDWVAWSPYTWEDVYVISKNDYDGVDPVELYSTYSGTNKIVVGDDTVTRIGAYKYKIYKDIKSVASIVKPL